MLTETNRGFLAGVLVETFAGDPLIVVDEFAARGDGGMVANPDAAADVELTSHAEEAMAANLNARAMTPDAIEFEMNEAFQCAAIAE